MKICEGNAGWTQLRNMARQELKLNQDGSSAAFDCSEMVSQPRFRQASIWFRFGMEVHIKKLLATLICVLSFALCASGTHPQSVAKSHQRVESPMATDERLEAPGWWPTKGSTSRQDFVGTGECARCHAKRTASQLTTPMAHASTPAASADILRESDHLSLQLGPYTYAISRGDGASVYSVSDSA